MKLKYVCDKWCHLICEPYSTENLHIMARQIGLDKQWFRKTYYEIPDYLRKEINKQCQIITLIEIREIIHHPEYAKIILSSEVRGTASPKDYFWQTQIEYNGQN